MTNSYPEEQKKIDEMYMERAFELAAKAGNNNSKSDGRGSDCEERSDYR
ncbi:MAG: hypothetical protein ACLSFZ_03570 [Frisingicoccus sp.]